MANLATTIQSINQKGAVVKKMKYNSSSRIKTFIITMLNDSYSVFLSRKLTLALESMENDLDISLYPATIPDTILQGLSSISYKNLSNAPWTWPTKSQDDGYCLKTGLYKKTYPAADQRKVIACAVSHMRLWQMCIDLNQPILVLEHDAWPANIHNDFLINDVLNNEKYPKDWGILGLNNPIGATRKAGTFIAALHKAGPGIHETPSVDMLGDLPLPQGLAGNSAYIIKPWAAKELLDKVEEIGMWPNDAIMCKQFFPWLKVLWPNITKIAPDTKSTTTN